VDQNQDGDDESGIFEALEGSAKLRSLARETMCGKTAENGASRGCFGRPFLVLRQSLLQFRASTRWLFSDILPREGEHSPAYEGVIFSNSSFTTASCPFPAANNGGRLAKVIL